MHCGRWSRGGERSPRYRAVITRRELAERFSPEGEFFSTFGGNPVAMAAALAVLEVIDDERTIDHAADVGEYLTRRLRDVAARVPRVTDFRRPEPVGAGHEVAAFDCGSDAQTTWLRDYALQAHRSDSARVYVVCESGTNRVAATTHWPLDRSQTTASLRGSREALAAIRYRWLF